MSTTTTPPAASLSRVYDCPKDGCPPPEDPVWVHIFFWSSICFFIVTVSVCLSWRAYVKRRERRELEDIELGLRLARDRIMFKVADLGPRKAPGLGYEVEVFRKSSTTTAAAEEEEEGGGGDRNGEVVVDCSICLEELEDGEDVGVIKSSGHVYHKECLEEWQKKGNNSSCPLCCADI